MIKYIQWIIVGILILCGFMSIYTSPAELWVKWMLGAGVTMMIGLIAVATEIG